MSTAYYLDQARRVIEQLDRQAIEAVVRVLVDTRTRGGRLFLAGSGGGAGHASHAACDFRKIAGFEAYCCTDNVSELTARINDEGWEHSISGYLRGSRIRSGDCLLVFSVGGGDENLQISMNLVEAVRTAKEAGASVVGVVGRDGGYTRRVATACVVVPTVDSNLVTALTESFQALLWHLLVSHPRMQLAPGKWESTAAFADGHHSPWPLRTTKVFADTADLNHARRLLAEPYIAGLTTNPTLMRKAGVQDYRAFAKELIPLMEGRPVSFEVFSDDFEEMRVQAREIASWGDNVYVKIPITNALGQPSAPLVRRLAEDGVKVNVTAMLTLDQLETVLPCVDNGPGAYVSYFAGRIADSGVDPVGFMEQVVARVRASRNVETIWASPREVLNLVQADTMGCHIITVTEDILKKIPSLGKNLSQFSLETVQMFRDDALACGYTLDVPQEA